MTSTQITPGAVAAMFRGTPIKDAIVQITGINPGVGTDGTPKRIKYVIAPAQLLAH